jgi:hypothetical protein
MGKKTLTNAHCLLELIEKAHVTHLKRFSGLPECQALARGFDWSQDAQTLPSALIEHVRHAIGRSLRGHPCSARR